MRFDTRLLSDLWFFTVAAESDTFEIAASRLAVTQSAVTQRIKRLEDSLGASLFVKDGRRLKLSPAGASLLEASSSGFSRVRNGVERLRATQQRPLVRVSCIPSLAIEWLTPRLTEFLTQQPEISIALFAEMDGISRNLMSEQSIDIAIRYGPVAPTDVHVLFSVSELVMPVASPELAVKLKADPSMPVTILHDTRAWNEAVAPTAEWDRWQDQRGREGLNGQRDQFFNMAYLAYSAAVSGNGVALGRYRMVAKHLETERLVCVSPAQPMTDLHYFVCSRSSHLPEPVQIFVTWLRELLDQPITPHLSLAAQV